MERNDLSVYNLRQCERDIKNIINTLFSDAGSERTATFPGYWYSVADATLNAPKSSAEIPPVC